LTPATGCSGWRFSRMGCRRAFAYGSRAGMTRLSVSVAIQKNRCRTTVAEPIGETRAELPFTGDQDGLFRARPGRPKRTCNSRARSKSAAVQTPQQHWYAMRYATVAPAAEGPMVRRLTGGGSWIRTIGPATGKLPLGAPCGARSGTDPEAAKVRSRLPSPVRGSETGPTDASAKVAALASI